MSAFVEVKIESRVYYIDKNGFLHRIVGGKKKPIRPITSRYGDHVYYIVEVDGVKHTLYHEDLIAHYEWKSK